MASWDRWADARYLSLTTFRRSREPGATPVWFAESGLELVVQTGRDSGKVKRVRNRADVTIAPCDMRGRTPVAATPARATILEAAEVPDAEQALAKKYGRQRRMFLAGGRLAAATSPKPAMPVAYLAISDPP